MMRPEKEARSYVDSVIAMYGIGSALARTRRMTFDPHYRHRPQWLAMAIAILEDLADREQQEAEAS